MACCFRSATRVESAIRVGAAPQSLCNYNIICLAFIPFFSIMYSFSYHLIPNHVPMALPWIFEKSRELARGTWKQWSHY